MAEIFSIGIEISLLEEKRLIIPETIRVPRYSIIQWDLLNPRDFFYNLSFPTQLVFTLYFSDKSPFHWKRQFIQSIYDFRNPFYNTTNTLRLAEDIADELGDFKYGVKVEEANSNKILYDEDPYLSVY